jgi:hypothetical protein
MAASSTRSSPKLFDAGAEIFGGTAEAMRAHGEAADRYRILGRRFSGSGRRLRSIDARANAGLMQAIAAGAQEVASALPAIASTDNVKALAVHATALAEGLERLSDSFVAGAQSLRSLPSAPAGRGRPTSATLRRKVNARVGVIHGKAVALSYENYAAALAVREAAGLEVPPLRRQFALPAAADGGCADYIAARVMVGDGLSPSVGGRPPRMNRKQLLLLVGRLDETSLLTADHLALLAGLFELLALASFSIACTDDCRPAGVVRVAPSLIAVRRVNNRYYPSLGFRWQICCRCNCYYFLTQQRLEITDWWGQVLVLDPQTTRSAAMDIARRRVGELASDFNNALSAGIPFTSPSDLEPALAPPACSCNVL